MQSLSVPLWPRFLRVHRLDPDGRQVRVLDPKIAHVKSGAQYFFQYFASSPLEVKPSCVEVGDDEDSDTSKNSMVGADAEEDQETSAHPQVPKASAQPPVINKFPCVACGTNVPCLSRESDKQELKVIEREKTECHPSGMKKVSNALNLHVYIG